MLTRALELYKGVLETVTKNLTLVHNYAFNKKFTIFALFDLIFEHQLKNQGLKWLILPKTPCSQNLILTIFLLFVLGTVIEPIRQRKLTHEEMQQGKGTSINDV